MSTCITKQLRTVCLTHKIVDCIDLFLKYLSTKDYTMLARTCRAVYIQILDLMRTRIYQFIKSPLSSQPIYYLRCPHSCNLDETPFFGLRRSSSMVLGCTNCLYRFSMSYRSLPSRKWHSNPSHEQVVKTIIKQMGRHHSLLPPNSTTCHK